MTSRVKLNPTEFSLKIERIRTWLVKRQYGSLLLESQTAVSWLTGGRAFISIATEQACAKILVSRDNVYVITNNIEASRLQVEEFPADSFITLQYDWYEEDGEEVCIYSCIQNRGEMARESEWENEIRRLRYPLVEQERFRYAELAADAAFVIETICKQVERGESEWKTGSRMAQMCLEMGIEPVLNLVGSDERALHFRHPLPTSKSIDKYVVLALGARRHGLVASVSRMVHFGNVPEFLKKRFQAVSAVDATLIRTTRPGSPIAKIIEDAAYAYAQNGFPDEWHNHHQGGLTGYQSREYKALPNSDEIVHLHEAFAWNPTVAGVKSEDTILINESHNQILTRSGDFPELSYRFGETVIKRPTILERPYL